MDTFGLTDKDFCNLFGSICHSGKRPDIRVKGFGNSMSPFLKSGETLIIRPIEIDLKNPIKIGDVVAIADNTGRRIIIHRVIDKKNNLLQIKGDNLKISDGWFEKTKILGIVVQKEKLSGGHFSLRGWKSMFISILSKTKLLNYFLLPLGRLLKKTTRQ